jgi:hypothetical protein
MEFVKFWKNAPGETLRHCRRSGCTLRRSRRKAGYAAASDKTSGCAVLAAIRKGSSNQPVPATRLSARTASSNFLGLSSAGACSPLASSMAARICTRLTRLKQPSAVGENHAPVSTLSAVARSAACTNRQASGRSPLRCTALTDLAAMIARRSSNSSRDRSRHHDHKSFGSPGRVGDAIAFLPDGGEAFAGIRR